MVNRSRDNLPVFWCALVLGAASCASEGSQTQVFGPCTAPPTTDARHPGLPTCSTFDGTGCIGAMIAIPPGPFALGCNETLERCDIDEFPQVVVTLPAFEIDATEITVAQYRACVDDGHCRPPRCLAEATPEEAAAWMLLCSYYHDGPAGLPMNCLSWYDARAYCAWAGKRLPSEAEWEKAARGGCELYGDCQKETRIYPWGADEPDCDHSVMKDGGIGCGTGFVMPVGQRPAGASAYGVLDMAGNLWEWTEDVYAPAYSADGAPPDASNASPADPRVTRGGDYLYGESHDMRAGNRDLDHPVSSHTAYGGRCARSIP